MKNLLYASLILILIISCKKKKDETTSGCAFFPITTGIVYSRTTEGNNNNTPYPTSDVGAVPANNNSDLIIGEYRFTLSGCDAGTVSLTYASLVDHAKIFDKNAGNSILYSGGGTTITQTVYGTSYASIVKNNSAAYPTVAATFTPNVGVTEFQYLNSSTGRTIYRWKKK